MIGSLTNSKNQLKKQLAAYIPIKNVNPYTQQMPDDPKLFPLEELIPLLRMEGFCETG